MTREVFEDRLHSQLTALYDELVPPASTTEPGTVRGRPNQHWLRRPVVVVSLVAALAAAGAATATAAGVFTEREKLMPPGMADTLAPGEETRIKGMGCEPGSQVVVKLDGVQIGTAVTETQPEGPNQLILGWYVADVTIPVGTTPGQHVITITCPYIGDGTELVETKEITVIS